MAAMRRGPARTPPREPFLHIPVPWVFVLGSVIGYGLQAVVPVQPTSSSVSNLLSIAGTILFLVGAGLAGWAWLLFRQAKTTAVPGEVSRVLVTHGPYRVTRNPMYVGLTIAYLGEAGALVQLWPVLVLPFVLAYVNWFVIPVEEASLKRIEGYGEYSARVHRWLWRRAGAPGHGCVESRAAAGSRPRTMTTSRWSRIGSPSWPDDRSPVPAPTRGPTLSLVATAHAVTAVHGQAQQRPIVSRCHRPCRSPRFRPGGHA